MAEKLKIIKRGIDDIREYDMNPRKNDKAVEPVLRSIEKFGYVNPIIINRDGVILAGHTRFKALMKEGVKEVECIQLTHLSDEEESAFRIADNRVADYAAWNGDLLQAEMEEISADDWEQFGFKPKEIKKGRECTCPRCKRTFEL